jgi:hypothetical protein
MAVKALRERTGGVSDHGQSSRIAAGLIQKPVIAIVLLAFSALLGGSALADSNGGTREYYSVNGARLYVESFGQGRPMLFLHGGLMFFDSSPKQQCGVKVRA